MSNTQAGGRMVRIAIAELERELRAALAGHVGQVGTKSGTSTGPAGTGKNHKVPVPRRLRLVETCARSAWLD